MVIVSDGSRVLTGVERSGDEPQMLARAVPRAAVLVSSSRYLAGRIAETRLGCTVHVLDDGFQHFDLMRDVDLLVAPDESEDRARFRSAGFASRSMPRWRPMRCGRAVDVRSRRLQAGLIQPAFAFTRRLDGPAPDRPAFAFAGIAKPQRFFGDLEGPAGS